MAQGRLTRPFYFLAVLLLVGCARATSPDLLAALAPAPAATQFLCGGENCNLAWQRAQLWISKHSRWKIQTATDVLIQTYNPSANSPTYGFTVSEEPMEPGTYRITIQIVCGNLLGCNPRPEDIARAFYYYLDSGKDLLAIYGDVGLGIH